MKTIVIKLSGKIFGMENTKTLKDYARFLALYSKRYRLVVVAGGGKIARHYITHARSSGADESSLNQLGIDVSRLNAQLLIYALKNKAYPHPPTTLHEIKNAVDGRQIVVTGGLHPGTGTNGTAALIAEKISASEFINATDVDGVYDLDPNKYPKAKKFSRINIKDLKNILIHEDSMAGGYDLMDIVALKIIERSQIKTRIVKADLKILEKVITGKSTSGTIITPTQK
ncbi:MAG: UMP kinase [Candidatus Nitrosoabyssus spongiisocia]|nr:MAG: UMP kinase [Nitrosopumilaceae archaeon AB1(1)]